MPPRIAPRKDVPVFLAEWRTHLGLTQRQVADELVSPGTDKTTISRYETEHRGLTLQSIAAYAEALSRLSGRKIHPTDLFGKPSDDESLDAIVARAPKRLRDIARDQVRALVKRNR